MDQDIAVRLANEGVPVRAIARVVQMPSAEVRGQLEDARAQGFLLDIPCEDWPAGYPREQRLLELARLAERNKPALDMAVRTVFRLSLQQGEILLLLLSNAEVECSRLLFCGPVTSVRCHLCRVRRHIEPFGLEIETLYGYGYFMPREHRRRGLDIILSAVQAGE